MKLRYTIIVGMLGLLGALGLQSSAAAYITVMGCCILVALRSIECQLGDLKGRLRSSLSEEFHIPTDRDLIVAWALGRSPEKVLANLRGSSNDTLDDAAEQCRLQAVTLQSVQAKSTV